MKNNGNVPICVDLDGTLIKNDLTLWSMETFVRKNVFNIFKLAFFVISKSWAYAKKVVAQEIDLDMSVLEYNKKFVNFLTEKRCFGTPLFLATASDEIYANQVADDLGIFDGVFASNGDVNLAAETKAKTLCAIFGEKGFIYAGNSKDDLKVWEKSCGAILVTPTKAALDGMKGKNYQLFE